MVRQPTAHGTQHSRPVPHNYYTYTYYTYQLFYETLVFILCRLKRNYLLEKWMSFIGPHNTPNSGKNNIGALERFSVFGPFFWQKVQICGKFHFLRKNAWCRVFTKNYWIAWKKVSAWWTPAFLANHRHGFSWQKTMFYLDAGTGRRSKSTNFGRALFNISGGNFSCFRESRIFWLNFFSFVRAVAPISFPSSLRSIRRSTSSLQLKFSFLEA